MILSFINIRKVPQFSTPPLGLANVNEWKIMFDPYTLNGPCHEKTCFMGYANKKMQSDQRLCCSLPRQQNIFTCYVQNFNALASF